MDTLVKPIPADALRATRDARNAGPNGGPQTALCGRSDWLLAVALVRARGRYPAGA